MESKSERFNSTYGVSIVGSANGLIVLVIEHNGLFLWNPSIRKYKKLPHPMMVPSERYVSWRVYGFGYYEFHDDYKVVIFNEIAIFRSCELKVKIYSLKSDSWRRLDDCPCMAQSDDCPHMALSNVSGKFLNGKLHWATTNCDFCLVISPELYMIPNIISFDLANEKWGEMVQPYYDEGKIHSKLEVLGSDLSVVCNCNKTHIDVWVMKEYGVKESWTKIFTIKYPENPSSNGNLGKRCLHMTYNSNFSNVTLMESEASHSIPFLPVELVTEILSRLPIKSLLKFKCASKSWLSLISSPEFVKIHLSVNANNKEYTHHKVVMMKNCTPQKFRFKDCSLSSLFNESRVTEAKDLNYPFKYYRTKTCKVEHTQKPKQYDVSIAGSANGLICLAIEHKQLFLWNPSIRTYKRLPRPIMVQAQGYVNWRVYGFGYDEFHDDYKVVIFNEIAIVRSYELRMYSLKSDSWRRLDDCPRMVRPNVSGKFVNGKLHWATRPIPNIISFDFADEKWGEMEQPCYDKGKIDSRLEVLGSDLSVVCSCNKTHLDVWVMKEYGVRKSWTKMFTIKYLGNVNLGKRCLHMTNEGEILVVIGSNFMIYNPKSDSLRYSEVINPGVWDAEEIYFESLVCPFSMGGIEDATK